MHHLLRSYFGQLAGIEAASAHFDSYRACSIMVWDCRLIVEFFKSHTQVFPPPTSRHSSAWTVGGWAAPVDVGDVSQTSLDPTQ